MENKLYTLVLCFLGFVLNAQAFPSGPDDVKKYWECAFYADCFSDKTAQHKITSCNDYLKPEEAKSVYDSVEEYYDWKSNGLYGMMKEACEIDDAEKPNAYVATLKGIFAYKKEVCANGGKDGACTRIKKLIDCHFGYLDQLNQEGRCQLHA